jgi:hypothetical protein
VFHHVTSRLWKFNMKTKFSSTISVNFYWLTYYSNLHKKTLIPKFWEVGIDSKMSPPTCKKRDFANNLHPQKREQCFNTFQCYSFPCTIKVMITPYFSYINPFRSTQCATKAWSMSRKIFILLDLKVSEWRIFFGGRAAPTSLQNHDVPNNEKWVNVITLIFNGTYLTKKNLASTH